jgi:[protein-PII] uridylyltransferase
MPVQSASLLDPMATAFRHSMPERYRQAFDADAISEHAAIVGRRAGAPVHGEIWRRLPKGGAIVCVVADDRPGLLSFISAALVVQAMDVGAAQAYTRAPAEGRASEAVDFLWLRRDADHAIPVLDADVARIVEVVRALIAGEITLEAVVRGVRPMRPAPPGASVRVTFDESSDAGLAVLAVETFDRPGLLLAVTQALFRARVQIIASDATTKHGRVVDRFTIVELDGTPIRQHRRGAVQLAVLSAIETLVRGEG